MTTITKIGRPDARLSTRQGGEIRILLSPISVGATSGFLGTLDLRPGEYVSGHYHPYSDEYLYVVRGTLTVDTGDETVPVHADEALMLPRTTPHRFDNHGDEPVFVVFQIGPLAPRPDLGHVETEPVPHPGGPPPAVGAPT